MIQFEVLGTPAPQGSKKAYAVKGRAFVKESNPLGHAQWRNAVASAAKDQATFHGQQLGALITYIEFRFPMPKSRTKAQRESGCIAKTTAPDIDKLQRAVFDGLIAGGLIGDDALIAVVSASKYEVTGWTGAVITLTSLEQP